MSTVPEQKDCGAYLCCCFSADRRDDDPRAGNPATWEVSMCNSFCKDPCCCLAGMILPCPTSCYMRHKVLTAVGEWPQGYTCCQSYFGCCCISNETIGQCCGALPSGSAPAACCCLFLESFLCCHVATQASRFFVMDRKQLMPDPCDNRLISFSNFLQCLACLFELAVCIASLITDVPQGVIYASWAVRLAADLFLLSLIGCMTAQTNVEIEAGVDVKIASGAQAVMAHDNPPPGGVQAVHMQPDVPVAQPVPVVVQAVPVAAQQAVHMQR
eukprot:CAMPEP_0119358250 /NCGR_PEP_ID=MMETSP1334-20130426/6497_1 /TAXON_ID=127549 /ORGANISM="Calcidiscus leptoporus, Strain RCC1130" /LENGTH=270 /DNA_ID=CAMNT_0007372697 /DNA_START=41 /DNA_END=853 /DNA_ORIENTATION=+